MNLMMITLLTVGSAVGQVPAAGHGSAAVEEYYDDCYADGGHLGAGQHLHNKRAIHHMAPQTCYSPRFGCYHSNERHMHRYPAFHGTFYRQAYNYRNYFDYPWHAQPHEPTSLFSFDVGEDQPEPDAAMTRPPVPPQARRPQPAVRPQAAIPQAAIPQAAIPQAVIQQAVIPVPTAPAEAPPAYTAPAPANRRINTSPATTVRPTSATQSLSSRRSLGSSGADR